MDGVVRDVNARVLVGRGLMLKDQGPNDGRVNQLLYADDTVLVGGVWQESKRGTIGFEFKRRSTRRGRHIYLRAIVGKNGGVQGDVFNRVNEGAKEAAAISRIWRVDIRV